jgi:L-seryl-tRNA(Ser) seleniumtransferase
MARKAADPPYRLIPSIERLRQRPAVRVLEGRYGAGATVEALRQAAADLRRELGAPGAAAPDDADAAASALLARASHALAATARGSLRRVINATGVVLHTNLGRAPLAGPALARLAEVARGYSNLEYDVARGGRGSRTVHAEGLLCALTGAEAAVVVNNNAAATMLALAGLAAGREVLISRGELVEIGGGFRVPDVMAQSGADLREVGTTNRTRLADYTAAIGPRTALVLRVHPSNFRIEGFTEKPSLAALVAGAHAHGIPVMEDLGSGNVDATLRWEPPVQASLAAGVDLVCVSGDKMLGGPQAGLLLGSAAVIDRLRRHPLMRALRVDKLTLAALEGTLLEHLAGRAAETVPAVRMLRLPAAAIRARAERLAATLAAAGWRTTVADGHSAVGGGSAPGVSIPTALLVIARDESSADALERWLRERETPVIARIEDDRVVLDLRTVADEDDAVLAALLGAPPGAVPPGAVQL